MSIIARVETVVMTRNKGESVANFVLFEGDPDVAASIGNMSYKFDPELETYKPGQLYDITLYWMSK